MSEINSPAKASTAFDRRAIVKGAAWSVPVIAVAMAAPAAAASPPPVVIPPTVTFDQAVNIPLTPNNLKLTAPTNLVIKDTNGAAGSSANLKVTIKITRPSGSAGIFIKTLNGDNQSKPLGALDAAYIDNLLTVIFYIPVASGTATQSFPLTYTRDGDNKSSGGTYTMTASVDFVAGSVSSVGQAITLK